MVATQQHKMVVTFRDGMWYGFNNNSQEWIELGYGDVPFETIVCQLRRQNIEVVLKLRTC